MRHPRRTAAALVLLTLVAGLLATRLRMDPNILVLLPEDEPTAQAIHRLNEEEGGANLLTVTVQGEDEEALEAFMVELRDAMAESERVEYALYDLDPELAWRLGVLQLTPDELSTLKTRLQGALALGPAAANPFVAARLLDLGPLTEKLNQSPDQASFSSAGEGLRRLVIRPNSTPYDPKFSKALMAELDGHIARLDPAARGLRVVWIGGAYRHSVEDVRNLTKDLGWTGAVSFVAVLCLIAIAFRDLRAILLVFVPLVAANIWTAGYAGAVIGKLNTFTSFFPAVLIGLGVDFSIHLYSRYREERGEGGSLEDAVVRAWDKAGPPCFTAGLTTAGGFCALWAAGFQGFQQLGTILAGGVVFCLTAVVLGLPLLILWREKAPKAVPKRAAAAAPTRKPPTYRLAPLLLLGIACVTGAAGMLLPRVAFEFDISELRPEGLSYNDLDETRQMLARESAAPVVVSFESEADLLEAHQRLGPAIEAGEIPEMSTILDKFSVLPPDQEARLALLGEVGALAREDNVRYLPLAVQQNLARIAAAELRPVGVEDLPKGARHMLGASDGHHRMMILPDGNLWDVRQNRKLYDAVQKWLPGESAAGEYLALAVLFELMQGDTPRVAGVALGLVLLFTLIDLRSVPRALGAVFALLSGMTWAGAAMVLFDLKLSLVNFVGVPILMGIGVDVVIHLLHRLHEEGPGRVRHALQTTGWASGLSAATTILSFAALSVASAEGIQSLGLLIVMGLTLVAAAGLTLVPLGWMTAWKVGGDLPRDLQDGGEE
jgi:predicted RND superfamily exporter protein